MSYTPARPRIIVGVDGSAASHTATEWAARHAVRTGRILTICTVVPDTAVAPDAAGSADYVVAQARAVAHNVAADVITRGLVAAGQPAGELCQRTADSDILVVGQHGTGWLGAMPLGSVPIQLAAHANCPVVVTRSAPGNPGHPVVVGIDGPAWTQPSLEFAFDVAAGDGLPVLGIAACPEPAGGRAAEQLGQALQPWVQKYPDLTVRSEVVRGGASRALIESSEQASLIVLGRRGRGGFPALRLGSVALHVLTLASCPVAILP